MTGWFLEITCMASLVACVINPNPNPHGVQRYYNTKIECDKAAESVAINWKPGSGAWVFRCIPTER